MGSDKQKPYTLEIQIPETYKQDFECKLKASLYIKVRLGLRA